MVIGDEDFSNKRTDFQERNSLTRFCHIGRGKFVDKWTSFIGKKQGVRLEP